MNPMQMMDMNLLQALNQRKLKVKPKKWEERTTYEKCMYYYDKTVEKLKDKSPYFLPFILAICAKGVYNSVKDGQEKNLIPKAVSPAMVTGVTMAQALLPLPISQ